MSKQETKIKKISRLYAVTGVSHGSIIEAYDKEEAERIFKKHYKGERILTTKNISNYNLENL